MRITIAIATLLTILLSFSCRKYPEGPLLSLRSKETRIVNTWACEKVIVNNQESTPFYKSYVYGFGADRSFSEYNGFNTLIGTWALTSNDDSLIVTLSSSQVLHRFKILRLKNKSLWVIESRNTSSYEWHLETK